MKRYLHIIFIMLISIPIFIFIGYIYYYISTEAGLHWFFRVLIIIATLASTGAFIKVSNDRIKEIRKGDEDDLSKY